MFKTFRFKIALRVFFLMAFMLLLFYFITNTTFYITMFILGVVIVSIFVDLIIYVDQTNRDFTAFLLGIKYEDFSATYSGHHKGKSFGELYDAFNQINRKFLEVRSDTEAHYQYLQTLVEHVEVGLLCIAEDGEVVLSNKNFKSMLKKPFLKSIDNLKQLDQKLFETIRDIGPGERELIKINIDDQLLQLALRSTEFKLKGKQFKLISLQNIKNELEEQELDAWQKLIRILTHEIMNSVAPIVSLTDTMQAMIGEEKRPLDAEQSQDIKMALVAIGNRGQGLMRFTETYRNLTRIPPPKFQLTDAKILVERVYTLLKPVFNEQQINTQMQLPKGQVFCQADVELIEQVLINLLKNAIDALEDQENPQIIISVQRGKDGKANIRVTDNGPGIPVEVQEQVFVPFYTTKEEGSGIGLSLSRQIMRMHKGQIELQSAEGEGTTFTLKL
ncbi:MAG: ATP-binding protein [Bacteroidota bacterium]